MFLKHVFTTASVESCLLSIVSIERNVTRFFKIKEEKIIFGF